MMVSDTSGRFASTWVVPQDFSLVPNLGLGCFFIAIQENKRSRSPGATGTNGSKRATVVFIVGKEVLYDSKFETMARLKNAIPTVFFMKF